MINSWVFIFPPLVYNYYNTYKHVCQGKHVFIRKIFCYIDIKG
nr:MAG TPA: hypothetical protein [Caudoviricetes sp.]